MAWYCRDIINFTAVHCTQTFKHSTIPTGRCIRDEGDPLKENDVCFTTFDESVSRKVDFSSNCGEGLYCKDVTSPLNFTYVSEDVLHTPVRRQPTNPRVLIDG